MCFECVELERGVVSLCQVIEQCLLGRDVVFQVCNFEVWVVDIYQVVQIFVIIFDLSCVVLIYVQQCVICYGDVGKGDGFVGIGLELLLVNFIDCQCFDYLSFYDLCNVIGLGVVGIDMLVFVDQFDECQCWDLVSYVVGLSVGSVQLDKVYVYLLVILVMQILVEVVEYDGEVVVESFCVLCVYLLLEQCGFGQLIDYIVVILDKSFVVYCEGDCDQVYDLLVVVYLEGFELVESLLDNVDVDLCCFIEKQLMVYCQVLCDGFLEIQVV